MGTHGDDDGRARDDLSGDAVLVELAEAGPLAEDLAVGDLDEVDLVLAAQGLDELDVLGLGARLVQDAQVRLTLVERLGRFAQAARESVVHERLLQHVLERVLDRHLAGRGRRDGLGLFLLDIDSGRGLFYCSSHPGVSRRYFLLAVD